MLGKLGGLALGGWLAWTFSFQLGWYLYTTWGITQLWAAPAILFVAGFIVGGAVTDTLFRRGGSISGGGLWSSSPVRWVIGHIAEALVWGAVGYVLWHLLENYFGGPPLTGLWEMYDDFLRVIGGHYGLQESAWILARLWLMTMFLAFFIGFGTEWLKLALGYGTRPLRRVLRAMKLGLGGSSRFAGLFEEWCYPWKPGRIMLGRSMYYGGYTVGVEDDRHFFTIATTRAGKGRTAIIPNLLTYPGSALVIDPKGQNAAVTAATRGSGGGRVNPKKIKLLNQKIIIVDPFMVLESTGVYRYGLPDRFNPLAEVDLNAVDSVEQIRAIADALVLGGNDGNPFWDNASRQIIAGVIAHVLVSPWIMDQARNLATVRSYLLEEGDYYRLDHMQYTAHLNPLISSALAMRRNASENAGGDIMTTVRVHVQWLDSQAMRDATEASDFSLKDLKTEPTTLYLILPDDLLKEHSRFLRLFVNLALRAARKGKKPRHALLFLLDEFFSLGYLSDVEQTASIGAGAGIKLWPIVQNLTQVQQLYKDNWETFLGNAGMWQAFAMNDKTTAEYLADRMGHHITWQRVRGPTGAMEWVPGGVAFLRSAVELARESSRDSGNQLVFRSGADTFLLKRAAYDRIFPREAYNPDPHETERLGLRDVFSGYLFTALSNRWHDARERRAGVPSTQQIQADMRRKILAARAQERIENLDRHAEKLQRIMDARGQEKGQQPALPEPSQQRALPAPSLPQGYEQQLVYEQKLSQELPSQKRKRDRSRGMGG